MSAVVVAVHESQYSQDALAWAAEEAVLRGLRLRILHTDPSPAPDLFECTGQVAVETENLPLHALPGAIARADDAAMVVLDGRTATTRDLIVYATVPVVVVAEPVPNARGQIVVGFDEPPIEEGAGDFALGEAALRKACLRMIEVRPYRSLRRPDMRTLEHGHQAVAVRAPVNAPTARWRERFLGVEVVCEVAHGQPAQILVAESARADLLVVGSRLPYPVRDALLSQARCPLALMPDAPGPR